MKRFLAMVLALCMLFSMQTVFASAEGAEKDVEPNETRTMEEILNEYHQKAAEAQLSAEKNTGASSRSAASGKTLEQETVDTLTAAGYEAYNVTGDNYESLENALKTDFGSLGLDPEGSYIIVISGDEENTQTNSNSRGRPFIEEVGGPTDGGSTDMLHTYNGSTYYMRYITTTAGNANYLKYGFTTVLQGGEETVSVGDLNVWISIMSSVGLLPNIGMLSTWISSLESNMHDATGELLYYCTAAWNIKYIQVYNRDNSEWVTSASTEYVLVESALGEPEYNAETESWSNIKLTPYYRNTLYSLNYNNEIQMKDYAAYAFTEGMVWKDMIESVEHQFDGVTVIPLVREMAW